MIWTILVLVVGIIVERKYHPRPYFKGSALKVDYNSKKGVRHTKTLFEW